MRMKLDIEWDDPREAVDFVVQKPGEPEVKPREPVRREGVEPPLIIIGPGGDFVRRYFGADNLPRAAGLDVQC